MLEMPSPECNLRHRQGRYELVGDVKRLGNSRGVGGGEGEGVTEERAP